MQHPRAAPWPELPYSAWRETAATLHLFTQIVGKIAARLDLLGQPQLAGPTLRHHRWAGNLADPDRRRNLRDRVRFHPASAERPQKLGRRAGPAAEASDRRRLLSRPDGCPERPRHHGRHQRTPNEFRCAPFSEDHAHAAYDAAAAHRFWRALVQADCVLKHFRSGFIGKVSPVHFFWGSFDLAVTRFSGRPRPAASRRRPGLPDDVVREAYSHEVSSAGFWPGSDAFPARRSIPTPIPSRPASASDTSRRAAHFEGVWASSSCPMTRSRRARPRGLLLDFLSTTYAAAADSGRWDRAALECPLGVPGPGAPDLALTSIVPLVTRGLRAGTFPPASASPWRRSGCCPVSGFAGRVSRSARCRRRRADCRKGRSPRRRPRAERGGVEAAQPVVGERPVPEAWRSVRTCRCR